MVTATGFFQDWSYDCAASSALAYLITSCTTSLLVLQPNNFGLLYLMKSEQLVGGIDDDCFIVHKA